MDYFVRNKLHEWGLSEWVEKFEDEEIDEGSLYCLDDQEIDKLFTKAGPRVKFKKKLKLLKKEQNTNQETVDVSVQEREEEAADLVQVPPSTSNKGKRKSNLQSDLSVLPSPAKRQREVLAVSYAETMILSEVKNIMRVVQTRLHDQDKLSAFLKNKISDLETDKRELVGVFGKTGAGKSSLINAIIDEDLLPSGSVNACTSVMIKVEANTHSSKYEADVEFITKEEWKDELWSFQQFLADNENQENEDDYHDIAEKLSAVYGEEWKQKSFQNLMNNKHFREIPEFLQSGRKIFTCESVNELSAECVKYTRSDSIQREGDGVKKFYWPLVKCVTVRVPNSPLLQHVTLVDLPGNGDCNKSRDEMWKGIVGDCSTVWIVNEINRAASEKEPWEILESVSSLIGNGGECQQIHFICTKSDLFEDSDDLSPADVRKEITERNMQAKNEIKEKFNQRLKIKKHFTEDSFRVFTVSSKEFRKRKHLNPDETEIPKLQEVLQDLNDFHSETLNYVSGARGILSLIQGANHRGADGKKDEVCAALERNMSLQLDAVKKEMDKTYKAFEKCLGDGVEKSKGSYEQVLKYFLYQRKKGGAFHKILKCVVENGGIHKPKKGKPINLNMKLASCLTDSIDEEFRKTFPNELKCGPFNGVINKFSLNTDSLIQKYKNVGLQLRFLKTEKEKIKTKLNRIIRKEKKKVYNSLTEKIEDIMEEGYSKAAAFRGKDSLKNMRETIQRHVHSKKDMFELAKNTMLEKLHNLMVNIVETLEKTLNESIELSFKTDECSLPDVSTELEMVKKHHDELKSSTDLTGFAEWAETAEAWAQTGHPRENAH